MNIENIIDDFLRNEIGGIVVTDENNNILFSDDKQTLPEHVRDRFFARVPLHSKVGERKIWELTDAQNDGYYRVLSVVKEYDGKLYRCHCITDVSELADLSKNISEYSRRISDFSDFQTSILEVLSKPYDSFLPALANLCKTDEAIIRMERKSGSKVVITTYNGEMKKESVPLNNETGFAFGFKRFDKMNGYRCLMSETASERRYAVFLKDSEQFSEDFFKDIAVYNVIRLYIENGVLREKIIYESEHDRLTDLYNTSKFTSLSDEDFGRPETLAVYIASVGDLEYMNDHFGNETGDALIKRASDSIRPDLNDDIKGFRIGGDKFAVVAANISEERANEFIGVWKKRLEELNGNDVRFKCTISCGMAYGKGSYDTDKLLEQADVGMYREKRRLKEELIKKAAVT